MTNVRAEEAKNLLETDSNLILLDVREKDEWELKHIKGCTLLPLSSLESGAEAVLKDKDQRILVYCHSGRRSLLACTILNSLGYTNLYNLLGGITAWTYGTESIKPWA